MNALIVYAIISSAIAAIAYMLQKPDPVTGMKEPATNVMLKYFVVAFLCIYLGMTFLGNGSTSSLMGGAAPIVVGGEPDF